MPDLPFPINAKNYQELLNQSQKLWDDMYENRIGGANVGDVFEIGDDDIFTIKLSTAGGLEKSSSQLQIKNKTAGGLASVTDGEYVVCKSSGGLLTDADGIYKEQYDFGTIACPAGTNPAADTYGDTLTLTAGTGVIITGTAATDTIDISLSAALIDLSTLTPTDGNIIVGDGTDWIVESGATARTSLGLGTGDSPNFAGLTIGTGGADVDYAVTFNGETNDGTITWMEDEDFFQFADDINLGGATNYIKISDSDGGITWGGTYKKKLAMRPSFVAGRIGVVAKPTPVDIGCFSGYSMPIYSSDQEELFWRLSVPGIWDGITNPAYNLIVCLAAEETEGDDFKIQVSWNYTDGTTGVIPATSIQDLTASGDCTAGHTAQYSVFKLQFTIDVDYGGAALAAGHILSARIRRIASGGTEVSDEIIVLDHWLDFTVDKVFKAA